MELRPARRVSLLGHPEVSERWLQQQIANDPTLLGLGDLDVRDAERRQPGAGRLGAPLRRRAPPWGARRPG